MKITVFCDVTHCSLIDTNISDEITTCILYPEDDFITLICSVLLSGQNSFLSDPGAFAHSFPRFPQLTLF
jgi:hypothetical protein